MVVSFDLSTKSCFLLTPSVTLWNSSSFHVKNVSPDCFVSIESDWGKKLSLWSKSGYVFIKRGKELKKFSNSHSFILKKIRIYFVINFYLFIPDQTLKALLEMLRDQQLLMTSIRFMAQSKQWTNVFTLSYSKPRHLWNELLLRQCQCYVMQYSKFDRESLLFILHLDI